MNPASKNLTDINFKFCYFIHSRLPYNIQLNLFILLNEVDFICIIVHGIIPQHRTAPSRFASQSLLLQLKRFLKCINDTISILSSEINWTLWLVVKVSFCPYYVLRELGHIAAISYFGSVRSTACFAFSLRALFSFAHVKVVPKTTFRVLQYCRNHDTIAAIPWLQVLLIKINDHGEINRSSNSQ